MQLVKLQERLGHQLYGGLTFQVVLQAEISQLLPETTNGKCHLLVDPMSSVTSIATHTLFLLSALLLLWLVLALVPLRQRCPPKMLTTTLISMHKVYLETLRTILYTSTMPIICIVQVVTDYFCLKGIMIFE